MSDWIPCVWECASLPEHSRERCTVELVHSPTGDRYAVRSGRRCLSVSRLEMDYEPLPSSRTEEWLADHRFASLEDAQRAATAWLKFPVYAKP